MSGWRRGAGALLAAIFVAVGTATAQGIEQSKGDFEDKFRQLDEVLPTPNIYRTASGEPGFAYWQQRADYDIEVELDEGARRLTAEATIEYTNNSSNTLRYLWLQLDQNRFDPDSMYNTTATFGGDMSGAGRTTSTPGSSGGPRMSLRQLRIMQLMEDIDFGYDITSVEDENGQEMDRTIVGTLMRIDLEEPLAPGLSTEFSIEWEYNLVDGDNMSA
ncbi:MAG: aminopeptidase, partial [Pseudomonadota bacterium]